MLRVRVAQEVLNPGAHLRVPHRVGDHLGRGQRPVAELAVVPAGRQALGQRCRPVTSSSSPASGRHPCGHGIACCAPPPEPAHRGPVLVHRAPVVRHECRAAVAAGLGQLAQRLRPRDETHSPRPEPLLLSPRRVDRAARVRAQRPRHATVGICSHTACRSRSRSLCRRPIPAVCLHGRQFLLSQHRGGAMMAVLRPPGLSRRLGGPQHHAQHLLPALIAGAAGRSELTSLPGQLGSGA